ncbi:hypothetical protein LSAT2_013531 [Lamellibrachia satsuma]|nr:hypothetical protein LSAT2_013531 [Lamellibrachia satsuma]
MNIICCFDTSSHSSGQSVKCHGLPFISGNQRDRQQPVYQVIPAYEQLVQNQTDVQQPVYEVIPGYEQPTQASY